MATILERVRSRRWLRNSLLGLAAFLVVLAVAGFLVAPPILKSFLVRKLSETLHRPATIREVALNPFALSATVRGFVLKDRNGADPFLSFEELYVNLEAVSLFRGGPILREIRLDRPFVRVARTDANTYNFSDLLEEFASKPDEPGKKPLRFSLNNIRVRGGAVEFLDGPKHKVHKVTGIELSVPFVSNIPYYVNRYVQPYFAAQVNGTPVDLRGRTKPFAESRETTFDIDIRRLDIPGYLDYVPSRLNVRIPSAFLDVVGKVTFTQYRDRPPTIGYSGRVALREVRVTGSGGADLVAFPLFEVDVASSDVSLRRVALSRVLLQSPRVVAVRDRSGVLNLQAMLRSAETRGRGETKSRGAGTQSGEPGWTVTADSVRIAGGTAEYRDLAASSPFSTTLSPVNLEVRRFTTARDGRSEAELSVRTESAEAVAVKGTFSIDPPASEGAIEIAGARLRKYAPYYAKSVLFTVEDGGLDLKTRYAATQTEQTIGLVLSELEAVLTRLRLRKVGETEDFLSIPTFTARNVRIDLPRREAVIGEVGSRGGTAAIVRPAGQAWNVASLVAAPPPERAAGDGPVPGTAAEAKRGEGAPWQVRLGRIEVDRYRVRFEDRVPSEAVTLEIPRAALKAENLSTRKDAVGKAGVSLAVGSNGSVSASGTVSLNPVAANLAVTVKDLDIVPFQPYFGEQVKILITGGKASADGRVTVGIAEGAGTKVAFAGHAGLSGFSSVDKAFSNDFLKWDSLSLTGIDAGYNPTRVSIAGIALSDFYSRLIVERDGRFNVQGIVEKPAQAGGQDNGAGPPAGGGKASAAGAAAQGPAPDAGAGAVPVTIGVVTLQGGTINFSDRYIKPAFSATMAEVGGRVSGLTSEAGRTADMDLRGRLGTDAPLEISGKVNPLASDLFVDATVTFKDIDLSPMTPYAGKYLGYAIQKGKLSLSLRYLIAKKKLDATNRVFIDQFTLGERVESQDATKLPVSLAVALLKNRNGEIELDVPVSGSLDDPKFSVGRIILKVLVNILVKAATSPFALLGALFGGGEELSYLEFEPGISTIDVPGGAKLASLGKALRERPALKVEIEGHVDPGKDPEGLRRYLFNRKVKAQKLKDMTSQGAAPVPLDNVVVAAGEFPKFLKAAYKAEKFPKPRNFIGMAKDLPDAEMEKLILAHIEVRPDDLRELALARAQAVKEGLLASGKVEGERVFLVEPKTLAPEKKDKVRDSRVDFRIK